jgi:alkyl hydroperoxide reductase subunit AhpC
MSARVQRAAPEFRCRTLAERGLGDLTLADCRGRWLVLLFLPLGADGSPTELIAFADRAVEFRALGADVIAASVDSAYAHLAWWQMPREQCAGGAISLPIIADFPEHAARDYGVLLDGEGVALRGLFVIDPQGIVRHVTIDELRGGHRVDDALQALRTAQCGERKIGPEHARADIGGAM